ncbi:MAG: isochorismatase family protein [Nocardioidaceae bacterium]
MTRALVVVDVQESFAQLPIWQVSSTPDIVDRVDRLVQSSREREEPVIWVLHAEPGEGGVFDPASGFVRVMDGLVPRTDELLVTKTTHNAFTSTNLQQHLTLDGIRELVICGIRTEQCCETTARLASDYGYAVTFVTEATATTPLQHPGAPEDRSVEQIMADPRTMPVDDVMARTEYALAGRFATIATVDEVVKGAR